MIPTEEIRGLTDRQKEVLCIVVENKLYENRDTRIAELSEKLGIAPSAVYRHLLQIERSSLLKVIVYPSEKGARLYERLRLEPTKPKVRETTEVLSETRKEILRYLGKNPDATLVELSEELGINESSIHAHLRLLMAVALVKREKSRAVKRGVPPYVYNLTAKGKGVFTEAQGTN